MQLCNSTFPSVSEWVCEFVSELRRNVPKNALFYKNIIRNDKLRKLTRLLLSQMVPKELFLILPYKILWSSAIGNILILYLRIFFQNFFFFKFFFFKCPKWPRSQLWDVSYVLVFFSCDMQLCNSTFPSVCEWVCESVTQKCIKKLLFFIRT